MDINVSIKFKNWFEVFTYQMGKATEESVKAGMPRDLANEVYKGAVTEVIKSAVDVNSRSE